VDAWLKIFGDVGVIFGALALIGLFVWATWGGDW
jgi:hypothetical protein